MKNVWSRKFIQKNSCIGCDTSEAFAETLETLGQTSYSLGQAVSLGHHDVETEEKDGEGNPVHMTIWHMPKTPADLLWQAYRNGIDSGYNANPGLTVEGTKISYITSGGTRFEIFPCWIITSEYYSYVCGWRLVIFANPGGTLERSCIKNGFRYEGNEDPFAEPSDF